MESEILHPENGSFTHSILAMRCGLIKSLQWFLHAARPLLLVNALMARVDASLCGMPPTQLTVSVQFTMYNIDLDVKT